jgi:predicted acylesterase/phospholipase RssA
MINIAFSGGGIKGLAYIGVLKYLEEKGIKIKAASGTSAGAIFALFSVLGIKHKQIKNIFYTINLNDFQNLSINNLFENFGLDNGDGPMNFFKAVVTVITGKESTTFAELYEKTKKELIIVGSCIEPNCAGPEYFTHKTFPNMKLIDALRISISIPLYYTYCLYNNKRYVDGALFANCPFEYFEDPENTIGVNVIKEPDTDCSTLDKYILQLLHASVFTLQNDKNKNNNIIQIKINLHILELDLSKKEKDEIIEIGYQKTKEYFDLHPPFYRKYTGRRNSI